MFVEYLNCNYFLGLALCGAGLTFQRPIFFRNLRLKKISKKLTEMKQCSVVIVQCFHSVHQQDSALFVLHYFLLQRATHNLTYAIIL